MNVKSTLTICLLALIADSSLSNELANYEIPDPALKISLIDQSETESFLSVCVDSEGRLFVGSREAVFAYDPDDQGGYKPAVELYRFPSHSWIYDIKVRGNDLYVQTTTTTYQLPEARVKRKGISVKPLLWGLPSGSIGSPSWGVHQGMHGLAWGPEGDLYISFGDMLWNYGDFKRPDHWGHWYFYTADGEKYTYNGQGGILRIRPDGSRVQIVATGLRNPCGLAFDNQWNLFSHDNDAEGMPESYVPGRLLHVTDGADFAWPRGWMVTKSPDRKDLLKTMIGGLGRTVPVGQSYYDEPLLPAKYRDNILLARWGQRTITAYPKWGSGATFRAKEQILVACKGNARPVGVTVGPSGRIFAVVCYMTANEKSPIYRSDLIVIAPKDKTSKDQLVVDLVNTSPEELQSYLGNPSWKLRQGVHQELLRRKEQSLDWATDGLSADYPRSEDQDIRILTHQIHLAAASRTDDALKEVTKFVRHPNSNMRRHAILALSEHSPQNSIESLQPLLVNSLQDSSPRVQLAALQALFRLESLPHEVIAGPACSNDTYLRQTATRLMAAKLSVTELGELRQSPNAKVRLAAVLAIGRQLTVPAMDFVPPESLKLGTTLGPRIYIDHEVVDLSKLTRIGHYTIADYWKVASSSHQQHFELLLDSLNDSNEAVRLQAAYFLSLLNDKTSEAEITKVRSQATEGRLASAKSTPVTQVWMSGPFPDLEASGRDLHNLDRKHQPEMGAVDVTATYNNGSSQVAWKKITSEQGDYTSQFPSYDSPQSTYALFYIDSHGEQRYWLELGTDGAAKVWQNGRPVWHRVRRSKDKSIASKISLDLTPGTNQILVRCQPGKQHMLALSIRALDRIAISIPEPENASLAERLKTATNNPLPDNIDEFLNVDWKQAVSEGDIANGRKLFASIGCAKCHAVSGSVGITGGPSLADVGKRFTLDYLVESVLLPSKKVSAFFRSSSVLTIDGKVFTGLITAETDTELELMLPDAKRVRLQKEDIEERKPSSASAMPQGLIKSPDELKDLLNYLLSDQ